MNKDLQYILDFIKNTKHLSEKEKDELTKSVKNADKELTISEFKLERTEKVKKTTAILLEETIEELEQKRKAVEEQNRELEIEASLERVRAVAMSMNKSEDLLGICEVSFKEFKKLGFDNIRNALIHIQDDEQKYFMNYDFSDLTAGAITKIEYGSHPIVEDYLKQIRSAEDAFYQGVIREDQLDEWKNFRKNSGQIDDPRLDNATALYYYFSSIGVGDIGISTLQPIDESQIKILKRFRNVFDLAYRRYNDITLAEEQAREAEIELALERVRARTMAMHHSNELAETARVLFEQFKELGEDPDQLSIGMVNESEKVIEIWLSLQGSIMNQMFKAPIEEPTVINKIYTAWKEKRKSVIIDISGDELEKYNRYLNSDVDFKEYNDAKNRLGREENRRIIYTAIFSRGILSVATQNPRTGETIKLLERFAGVFDGTYTRFLDIQKAEAQAREAQIELSLERIRAQVTAMRESSELLDIVVTMRTEFVALGHEAHYFWYMRWLPDKYEKAMTSGDGTRIGMVMSLPRHIHGDVKLVADWEKSDEPTLVFAMDVDTAVEYVEKMISLGDFKQVDPQAPTLDDIRHIGGLTFVMARTTHGEIGFSLPGSIPNPPKDSVETLVRFASVFDLTYKRFEDLKEAETRAKESKRQASLDRVRAEIASMRTSEDLNRITPIIWRELKTQEVPFIRCGIFIIDEVNEKVRVYLTTPDGKSLAALNLHFNSNELTSKTVEHWKNKKIYKEHWNKKEFINWTKSLIEIGQIQNAETYQGSSEPPESLVLHFVPFAQGMLYAGDVSFLSDEKLVLVKTLAEAFSIAYARYEDFKNLEEAKNKIEVTLKELKAAQSQLIHTEKMASLGELTAGIAHEIKNPLNFVNNFSEVSRELLDEMKTEIKNKNIEEVIQLIEDLKQNLEKINQHGKRAASIVKGMLLHSRGSSGEKTLTDINELLDQYVNLAYHGMRAQNKEFNISIEKDYDETLEKINVVPQDISRVFLNIINNACYAAYDKKKKSGNNNFSPTLSVSTKNSGDKVEIRIGDNGNGIPKEIIDKIFQPFFTTKPTGEATGLGLSLSYDIVTKVHGGEINFKSKEDSYTECIITLPKYL